MFVTHGAGKRLLQGERQRFLEGEWPKVRAKIERLGLTLEELMRRRRVKEER
jgi:GntR family transcriptional regulator